MSSSNPLIYKHFLHGIFHVFYHATGVVWHFIHTSSVALNILCFLPGYGVYFLDTFSPSKAGNASRTSASVRPL